MRVRSWWMMAALLLLPVACGPGDRAQPAATDTDDAALSAALATATTPAQIEAVLDAQLRPLVEEPGDEIRAIIGRLDLPAIEKHQRIAPILKRVGPVLRGRAQTALTALAGRELGPAGASIRELLHHARVLGEGAQRAETPLWKFDHVPSLGEPFGFYADVGDIVADRFWQFYHWTEILGGMYDDTDYTWVFADSGRTSFLAQEAGAAGFEQFHDWWQAPQAVWDDPSLSANEKFMAAKYTMWQNADWGGGGHYIDEWWSWEAAYKEEDCALFTGNNMAALAALYELTRDARTLRRLRAMLTAFEHFDRITRDDPDPLALEDPDGRITRGTKTRQLYLADEPNLMEIEFVGGEIVFRHNNSAPDLYTGRERKNVSRDQYYGMLLGYRTLWEALTALPDRTADEQALLDDLVAHTTLAADYLFNTSRLHWDWGWEYMFYALFEGSCANPPNLSFMVYFAHGGIEEMTGQTYQGFDALHDLGEMLFAFGRSLAMVEVSAMLFEPAHTGLTALNQYLTAFYLSDITLADWLFIWPPELVDLEDAGRRRLWRRVVAGCYRKFGHLVGTSYLAIAQEVFDEVLNPRETPQRFFNSYRDGYARLEPAGVALEDYLLPFAFLAGKAANRDEVTAKLLARYDALVASGEINFDDTDLPEAMP